MSKKTLRFSRWYFFRCSLIDDVDEHGSTWFNHAEDWPGHQSPLSAGIFSEKTTLVADRRKRNRKEGHPCSVASGADITRLETSGDLGWRSERPDAYVRVITTWSIDESKCSRQFLEEKYAELLRIHTCVSIYNSQWLQQTGRQCTMNPMSFARRVTPTHGERVYIHTCTGGLNWIQLSDRNLWVDNRITRRFLAIRTLLRTPQLIHCSSFHFLSLYPPSMNILKNTRKCRNKLWQLTNHDPQIHGKLLMLSKYIYIASQNLS